jgi:hypothetical protein
MYPVISAFFAATMSRQRQIRKSHVEVGEAVGDGLAGADVLAVGVADGRGGAVLCPGADDVAAGAVTDGVAAAVLEGCVALG